MVQSKFRGHCLVKVNSQFIITIDMTCHEVFVDQIKADFGTYYPG